MSWTSGLPLQFTMLKLRVCSWLSTDIRRSSSTTCIKRSRRILGWKKSRSRCSLSIPTHRGYAIPRVTRYNNLTSRCSLPDSIKSSRLSDPLSDDDTIPSRMMTSARLFAYSRGPKMVSGNALYDVLIASVIPHPFTFQDATLFNELHRRQHASR